MYGGLVGGVFQYHLRPPKHDLELINYKKNMLNYYLVTTWWRLDEHLVTIFQPFSWDLMSDLVYKKGHFPPTFPKKLSRCNQFTKTQGTVPHLHHSLISDSEKAVFLTKKTTSSSSKTEALGENIWKNDTKSPSLGTWHWWSLSSRHQSLSPFDWCL